MSIWGGGDREDPPGWGLWGWSGWGVTRPRLRTPHTSKTPEEVDHQLLEHFRSLREAGWGFPDLFGKQGVLEGKGVLSPDLEWVRNEPTSMSGDDVLACQRAFLWKLLGEGWEFWDIFGVGGPLEEDIWRVKLGGKVGHGKGRLRWVERRSCPPQYARPSPYGRPLAIHDDASRKGQEGKGKDEGIAQGKGKESKGKGKDKGKGKESQGKGKQSKGKGKESKRKDQDDADARGSVGARWSLKGDGK